MVGVVLPRRRPLPLSAAEPALLLAAPIGAGARQHRPVVISPTWRRSPVAQAVQKRASNHREKTDAKLTGDGVRTGNDRGSGVRGRPR
jgi:hypothetical protein